MHLASTLLMGVHTYTHTGCELQTVGALVEMMLFDQTLQRLL